MIKYIIAIILIVMVLCAPAYLAQLNKKDKTEMVKIRIGSWLFGWSIIGWIWALFAAVRK